MKSFFRDEGETPDRESKAFGFSFLPFCSSRMFMAATTLDPMFSLQKKRLYVCNWRNYLTRGKISST
jgi:hypothetical protein